MKILSYRIDEDTGMLVVTTDNPGRNEFVYEADRFNDMNELLDEINKSISMEYSRKQSISAKISKVREELDADILKVKP